MSSPTVLISGAGSIGKRHLKNLHDLGVGHLMLCDPDAVRVHELSKEIPCNISASLEDALAAEKPDVVFVCSPTRLHVPQAQKAAEADAHLFIEKPLSHTLEGIGMLEKEIKKRRLICMVGCNMRFHFGPATVKRLLDEGKIGTVTRATVYTGSFLPDWRPQQDYRKSYSADPEQGGAILDCIHEIDLALWYLGPATLEKTVLQPATSLNIPVEGTADLTLSHVSGATSAVHLSFMEPGYRRFCRIEGTEGTIEWDIGKKTVMLLGKNGTMLEAIPEPVGYDLNQMYMEEIRHFLDCIKRNAQPQGNLQEATAALEIALEAKGKD